VLQHGKHAPSRTSSNAASSGVEVKRDNLPQPHAQRTDEFATEQAAPLRVPAQHLQVLLREGAAGPLCRLCSAEFESAQMHHDGAVGRHGRICANAPVTMRTCSTGRFH